MTKASRTFVHHYAGVAIIVGLLSSFGTWTVTRFVTASRFSSNRSPICRAARSASRCSIARPGAAALPHWHPGHHTFGYVVEDTYEFAIDG